jgi:hypothetical protein
MSFENNFDKDLKDCINMDQVLDVVQKHYDLKKPFGIATKLLVITGVKKIIKLIQAVQKNRNNE